MKLLFFFEVGGGFLDCVLIIANAGFCVVLLSLHPQKKKISWCVSSQPHNFRVITQGHGLIDQVKGNLDLTKLLNV